MGSDGAKLRCGCCGCLALSAIVLFALSWASLEFQEYGLDYNSFTQSVDDATLGSGRYFLGVGHSFILFPKVYQTIEYSAMPEATGQALQSRTKDGVEVVIMISFQYQIDPAKVYDLYQKYGDENYKQVFSYMARDILTDVATQYNAVSVPPPAVCGRLA
jgi:hypothetical protein